MYEVVSLVAGSAVVLAVGAIAVNKFLERHHAQDSSNKASAPHAHGQRSTTSYFETKPARRDVEHTEAAKEALEHLHALTKIPVETGHDEHEALLEALWEALKPGVQRRDRITRMWGQIGFQGTDPVTDFRGMGELALRSIARVCERHPEIKERCLREDDDRFAYFFAIAGINLCQSLYRMLTWHNELVNRLFEGVDTSSQETVLAVFSAALADTWLQFDNFYINEIQRFLQEGGPPELIIMQFEHIRNKFEPNLFVRWEKAAQADNVSFFESVQQAAVDPPPHQ